MSQIFKFIYTCFANNFFYSWITGMDDILDIHIDISPWAIFLNSNSPEKYFRMFKKKSWNWRISRRQYRHISTFQCLIAIWFVQVKIMSQVNTTFIDQLCFADISSLFYISPNSVESTKNGCESALLNEDILE